MKKISRFPWFRILGALALAAALGTAGWTWIKGDQVPVGERYRTVKVERGSITQTVSANGTLTPVVLVSVGTQVSGTVLGLHADFNQRVTKGQVLAELDPALLVAAEKQSLANVASAEASLKLARANEDRLLQLFAQEYISRQEMDQGIQIREAAQAQVQLGKAQLERDRTNLRYSVIRSPVSGVVVDRQIDLGQTVAASFQTPTLFKIAQDLKKMQIDSNFAEADVGRIKVDQPVRFTVDAFPERTFTGVVRQVRLNPLTVQNVVTYDVVVAVGNPDEILLPGMTAYVNVVLAERTGVLKVPNAALRFHPPGVDITPIAAAPEPAPGAGGAPAQSGGKPGNGARPAGAHRPAAQVRSIYVMRNGAAVAVRVQLGGTDRRYTEVSGELKEGDLVAIGLANPGVPGGTAAPRIRMF